MTDPNDTGRRRAWPALIGVPLVVLAALAAFLLLGGGQEDPRPGERASGGGAEPERGTGSGAELGHPSLGREDAPVVMVEYADYQ